MITNEQINERADELTSLFEMAGYGTFTTDPLRIYRNLTREALGRDKESLQLLECYDKLYRHTFKQFMSFHAKPTSPEYTGITDQITTLRKRLGLKK